MLAGYIATAGNTHNSQVLQNKNAVPAPDLLPLIAAVLRQQSGSSDALCYGVGEADTLAERQNKFLNILSQSVIQHCSVDSVVQLHGNSLSQVAASLQQEGLKTDWNPHESRQDQELAKPIEAMIVEGSISRLDQLGVLSQARETLVDNGFLFLFGEYVDDDSATKYSALANISSLHRQTERLGFAINEETDYSADALSCIRSLLNFVQASPDALAQELGLESSELNALVVELTLIAQEFESGRRCFRLFVMQKQENPAGEYAGAEYGDIKSFDPAEIKDLFEASFGVDFDPKLWHWKYNLGGGVCVVARAEPGGTIVSHYGGAPRKINYFGKPSWALQSCDVMVLPEMRRQYGRNSLFFKTAATFLEREEGNIADHLLGFGFPNQKAMNIALRLNLYEKTDDFIEVGFSLAAEPDPDYIFEAVDIEEADHCQLIDGLWHSMSGQFEEGIIGIRDSAYVRYRYFDHPFAASGQYRAFLVKNTETSQVEAFVVLKNHDEGLLLMDMICDQEQFLRMLDITNALVARESDSGSLKFWITRGWQKRLQLPDSSVKELGIEIPCNSWNPGPSAETLYGAWWLTAGDMDFI